MAEWLSALNRSSSHHCGFEPGSGHQSSACGWSGGFFSKISRFCPILQLTRLKMSEIFLRGRKTQIKKNQGVMKTYNVKLTTKRSEFCDIPMTHTVVKKDNSTVNHFIFACSVFHDFVL